MGFGIFTKFRMGINGILIALFSLRDGSRHIYFLKLLQKLTTFLQNLLSRTWGTLALNVNARFH